MGPGGRIAVRLPGPLAMRSGRRCALRCRIVLRLLERQRRTFVRYARDSAARVANRRANLAGEAVLAPKRLIGSFVLLSVALAAGCSRSAPIPSQVSAHDLRVARQYVEDLRAGRVALIDSVLSPAIPRPQALAALARMRAMIPGGNPRSAHVVGAQILRSTDGTVENITFEYQFPSRWLLFNVALLTRHGKLTLEGMHVHLESSSLAAQNRFGLLRKSPLEYATFALAIGLPLFTLYALIVCLRSSLTRWKWLWALCILIGFGKLAVNWTTGIWTVSLFAVQVFSTSAERVAHGPWSIAVSVPLGAIVFLIKRKSLGASQPMRKDSAA